MTTKPPLKFLQIAMGFQAFCNNLDHADAHRLRGGLIDMLPALAPGEIAPFNMTVAPALAAMAGPQHGPDPAGHPWRVPITAWAVARSRYDEIMRLTPRDMPPATDDVSLLLDTVSFRLGLRSRAAVWDALGIAAPHGRQLMGTRAENVLWPLFFTLRVYAFGDEMETR